MQMSPFSRADVNKAPFEARLQNLGDTELKYPWEHGVMGDFLQIPTTFQGYLRCLLNIWALQINCMTQRVQLQLLFHHREVLVGTLRCLFIHLQFFGQTRQRFFAEPEVLWTRALDKWSQVFEVLCFPGQLGDALVAELQFWQPIWTRYWSVGCTGNQVISYGTQEGSDLITVSQVATMQLH